MTIGNKCKYITNNSLGIITLQKHAIMFTVTQHTSSNNVVTFSSTTEAQHYTSCA